MKTPVSTAALLFLFLGVAPGWAGIADSPIPSLGGTTYHLYSIPGAQKYVNLETVVSCTSADSVPVDFGVEFFTFTGGAPLNGLPGNGNVTLPPGGTGIIASGPVAGSVTNVTVFGMPSFGGSARVVSTSKKLLCTAMLISAINQPPTSVVYLPIIKKTKQKASN